MFSFHFLRKIPLQGRFYAMITFVRKICPFGYWPLQQTTIFEEHDIINKLCVTWHTTHSNKTVSSTKYICLSATIHQTERLLQSISQSTKVLSAAHNWNHYKAVAFTNQLKKLTIHGHLDDCALCTNRHAYLNTLIFDALHTEWADAVRHYIAYLSEFNFSPFPPYALVIGRTANTRAPNTIKAIGLS